MQNQAPGPLPPSHPLHSPCRASLRSKAQHFKTCCCLRSGGGVECLQILFQIWRWGFQGLFHPGVLGGGGCWSPDTAACQELDQALWLVKSKRNCLLKKHNSFVNGLSSLWDRCQIPLSPGLHKWFSPCDPPSLPQHGIPFHMLMLPPLWEDRAPLKMAGSSNDNHSAWHKADTEYYAHSCHSLINWLNQ